MTIAGRHPAIAFDLVYVQGFANGLEPGRAYAISAALILLNLLKRDTQFPAEIGLAHVEREPAFSHSGADIFVDVGCASWCGGFSFCLLHADY
jgi:hypothetical protein